MKRLLLTGGGGFVGAHTFAHIMHNTDWEVVVIDSFRHKGKTDRLTEMLDSHPDWKERLQVEVHDLRAPFSEQLIYRIGKIDYIINMASESHVDRSIEEPVEFIKNNVDLVLNVLEYARVIKPEKFIQISTDEVYGPMYDKPHPEWSSILPSNPYSASKASQEAIAIAYWRTYGVPVIITNTMNIIGEMQDPEKFLPMLIQKINKGEKVTIHGKKGDIGSRFYLHARNQADALLFILNNAPVGLFPDYQDPIRLNVVGEVQINNLNLAKMVAEIMGKKLKYQLVGFHSTRPGHDPHYGLDGWKLEHLGWTAPLPFYDSLKNTVEWTLDHPEWLL